MKHKIEIIPGLTQEKICQCTPPKIYERGAGYYKNGAVTEITRRGNEIDAMVEGSQYEPYHVKILFDKKGLNSCHCSCPYEDDFCKHIVATLITCLIDPDKVEERSTLAAGIEKLNRSELSKLVEVLVGNSFEAQRKVDLFLDGIENGQEVGTRVKMGSERKLADAAFYENEVLQILHRAGNVRNPRMGDALEALRGILRRACDFMEKGDTLSGIVLLRALTKVFMEEWFSIEETNYGIEEFFSDLDDAWCFAVTKMGLSKVEKQKLLHEVSLWVEELEDYGLRSAFTNTEYILSAEKNNFRSGEFKLRNLERTLSF